MFPSPWLDLVTLVGAVWIAYWGSLSCGWVSDDFAGIVFTDESRNVPYQGELRRPISFHRVLRWLRFHIAKVPNPDPDWKRKGLPEWVCSPVAHHRLNLHLFSGVAALTYIFLYSVLGNPVAFLGTLLFVCHPLGVQAVTWVSGIGYLLGAFLTFTALMSVHLVGDTWYLGIPLFVLLQWAAVQTQFATVGTTVILLFLGRWEYALISLVISVLGFKGTLTEALTLRVAVFKEQQMGTSTSFVWRKVIVVAKTVGYYFYLVLFPKRMGLYHVYGYHYEVPYIEREDWRFWWGLLVITGMTGLVIWGPVPVKLGVLILGAYGAIFWNWITANQFIAERYMWLPSLGASVLVAWVLWSLGIPWLYWLVLGIALMRLWAHIPTYDDEVKFYFSNLWNFPNSEVAAGNLGVAQMQRGLLGSAMDTWTLSTKINPEYDVPWYNLASIIRGRGPISPNYVPHVYEGVPEGVRKAALELPQKSHVIMATGLLSKATEARTCHFPDRWIQEYWDLVRFMPSSIGVDRSYRPLSLYLKQAQYPYTPLVSVVIPAKSKTPQLERLIRSLWAQSIPPQQVEILVVHTGNSEGAKAQGIRMARGKYICMFCADNEVTDEEFLAKLVRALKRNPQAIGAYTAQYQYLKQDTLLSRYFALLGANDPLCWFMGKADRADYTGNTILGGTLTLAKDIPIPSLGDNGFMFKAWVREKVDLKAHERAPMDFWQEAVNKGYSTFEVVGGTSLWHRSGQSVLDYFRRRYRYVRELYFKRRGDRSWHMVGKGDWKKVLQFTLMSVCWVPHLRTCVRGYKRVRDIAWFLHPLVCFGLTIVYGWCWLRWGLLYRPRSSSQASGEVNPLLVAWSHSSNSLILTGKSS